MTWSTERLADLSFTDAVKHAVRIEPRFRRAFRSMPTLDAFRLIRHAGSRATPALAWFIPFSMMASIVGDMVMNDGLDSPEVAALIGLEPVEVDLLLVYADIAREASR